MNNEKKKRMSLAEKWESLTFADNYIFCKVLEDNPDVTKEILELLLDIKIDHIEQPRKENSLQVDFMSKRIQTGALILKSRHPTFQILQNGPDTTRGLWMWTIYNVAKTIRS